MIEILSFILIAALFFGLSLASRARVRAREEKLAGAVADLRGRNVRMAKERFGEPTEVVFVSSGWRLYVWKLPEMEITARVDPSSVIVEASWAPL